VAAPVFADTPDGAEARRGDQVIAWLHGSRSEDEVRGRHVWASLEDHGLAAGEDPELYRDLYALAGARWLEDGYVDHYVVVRADERVLAAWYGLAFAQQQAHAARALDGTPGRPPPAGLAIQRGSRADIARIVALGDIVWGSLREAPVWSPLPTRPATELAEGWEEVLAEEGAALFVAERDDSLYGYLLLRRRDDVTVELALAATRPRVRGLGAGVALTERALEWAHGAGYRRCITDWRVASLPASRFWPRRGFRPTAYRLTRSLATGV
jgi:GNAT superfamily N-acetyltransferase